ncbi:MAG: response regulator [Clostridia bacterium]|nr:response regulator [Clostridia bacterium]
MKNILVVDKSERNIVKIKAFSKRHNIQVYEAHNVLETINQLNSHEDIEVVLIDVNLDQEDGFNLVERVREEHDTLPIIILTTLNSKQDFVHGLRVGATDYLLKPFDEPTFIKRVLSPSLLRIESHAKQVDSVDIKTLIRAELVKAKKGHYNVTFGVAQYFNPNGETNLLVEEEYSRVSEKFYPGLKSIFWETDFVLRYGNQTFVFVLPFCSKAKLSVVERKLNTFSERFMTHHALDHYRMVSTFFSYPDDSTSNDNVIEYLVQTINDIKQKELSDMIV